MPQLFMSDLEVFTNFLTVLAIIIIFKGLISFVYIRLIHKTKYGNRSKDFLPTRLFGFYENGFWHYFYLSVLWLIVYYFEFIKELLRGLNG